MRKTIKALLAAALMGATAAGCTSTAHTGGSTGGTGGGQDCGYSWKPCKGASGAPTAPAPEQSTYHSIYGTDTPTPNPAPAKWGDYTIGTCSISLYPPNVGLTVSHGQVVLLAGTACVIYQPQEFTLHIHLERWYSAFPPGSTSKTPVPAPNWHEVFTPGWPVVDHVVPPLAVLDASGEVPLALQHQITATSPCAAATYPGEPSLYRLSIDVAGVSYSGAPFIFGGDTTPLIVPASEC